MNTLSERVAQRADTTAMVRNEEKKPSKPSSISDQGHGAGDQEGSAERDDAGTLHQNRAVRREEHTEAGRVYAALFPVCPHEFCSART